MAESDRLILQVSKAAENMGGLISLLLAVKGGRAHTIIFDSERAQFYADGKTVNITAIRDALAKSQLAIAALIINYNEKLWKKEWTLSKWRSEMEKLLENSHYIFGALALGGIATAAANPTVNRRLTRDLTALGRFAAALRAGQVPSLPLANNRGRSYILSIRVTFWLLDHVVHNEAGFTEAKRVLTPAEHCHNRLAPGGVQEGCYEAALRGWMDIVEMPPIGTLVCGQFCKCYIIYR